MRRNDMECKRLLVWAKSKKMYSLSGDRGKWNSIIDMLMRYPDLVDRHEMAHKIVEEYQFCDKCTKKFFEWTEETDHVSVR